jgi:transcription elongation factor Elf1
MPQRIRPVIAYNCPHCGNQAVVQRRSDPEQLLDWEDTLFVDLVFECTHCEWTDVVGRTLVRER